MIRIAQVAPLYDVIPPSGYGGVERVVHYLTESLVTRGHDVTLFAATGSSSTARIEAQRVKALRYDSSLYRHDIAAQLNMLFSVRSLSDRFDIIHFHTDVLQFPLFGDSRATVVTTVHTQPSQNDARSTYYNWNSHPLVALSSSHQSTMPECNWLGHVHNGLPRFLYSPSEKGSGYLVFLGRFHPDKGAHIAIKTALSLKMPLFLASRIDANHIPYFEKMIKPYLDHPLINFVGEVDDKGKQDLLGGADALLFPISWPEPFGLVMIEALACGTPVAAINLGAVSEIIQDGVNGAIACGISDFRDSVERALRVDRAAVRKSFDEAFTAEVMAEGYLRVYNSLLSDGN